MAAAAAGLEGELQAELHLTGVLTVERIVPKSALRVSMAVRPDA